MSANQVALRPAGAHAGHGEADGHAASHTFDARRPLVVGTVHGLAGSAAVALLVLAAVVVYEVTRFAETRERVRHQLAHGHAPE